MDGEVRSLLCIGRRKFGNPDAESESLIHEIKGLDRLYRMLDAALTVNSWQELLATK